MRRPRHPRPEQSWDQRSFNNNTLLRTSINVFWNVLEYRGSQSTFTFYSSFLPHLTSRMQEPLHVLAGFVKQRYCLFSLRAYPRQEFLIHQKMTNPMQLHIRGQETTVIDCVENDRIQHIKKKIACLHSIEDEFHLYCNGSLLTDEACVGELPSNVLDLTVPLRGGKVHGSLARAGKVKAQTPKVEKQEKSKKKTGRAKRRIQYNRRFVNVVQTFGRRRGPNANTNS